MTNCLTYCLYIVNIAGVKTHGKKYWSWNAAHFFPWESIGYFVLCNKLDMQLSASLCSFKKQPNNIHSTRTRGLGCETSTTTHSHPQHVDSEISPTVLLWSKWAEARAYSSERYNMYLLPDKWAWGGSARLFIIKELRLKEKPLQTPLFKK